MAELWTWLDDEDGRAADVPSHMAGECARLAESGGLSACGVTLGRDTNLVERLNEEILRRTRVARLFPNEASCLRLVSAVLMEIAEDWQTAEKRYLTFSEENTIGDNRNYRKNVA